MKKPKHYRLKAETGHISLNPNEVPDARLTMTTSGYALRKAEFEKAGVSKSKAETGAKGNATKAQDAKAWQDDADKLEADLLARRPHLSKPAVAEIIHEKCGRSFDTVLRYLRRPRKIT